MFITGGDILHDIRNVEMAIDMYTIGEGGLLGGSPGATQS